MHNRDSNNNNKKKKKKKNFRVLKTLYMEGGSLLIHHQCAASTWMI